MSIYQLYNKIIKAWVKYHFKKNGVKFIDVKQKNPQKPFKNVPKR